MGPGSHVLLPHNFANRHAGVQFWKGSRRRSTPAIRVPRSTHAALTLPVMVSTAGDGEVPPLRNPQTDIPRIAKDAKLIQLIEKAVCRIPTAHILNFGDARRMSELQAASIHLVGYLSAVLDPEGVQGFRGPDGPH